MDSPGASSSLAIPSIDAPVPSLRLVVKVSNVLPRTQRVAVLDRVTEVTLGRSSTALLRLHEHSVSKRHARVFFDRDGVLGWAVLDLGSLHGTTLNGERLSPTHPCALKHGDELVVGSTTLVAHAHRDALPCGDCVLADDNDEIPLQRSRARPVAGPTPVTSVPKNVPTSSEGSKRPVCVPGAPVVGFTFVRRLPSAPEHLNSPTPTTKRILTPEIRISSGSDTSSPVSDTVALLELRVEAIASFQDGQVPEQLTPRRKRVHSFPHAIGAALATPVPSTQRPHLATEPRRPHVEYISRHTTFTLRMPPGPSHPSLPTSS